MAELNRAAERWAVARVEERLGLLSRFDSAGDDAATELWGELPEFVGSGRACMAYLSTAEGLAFMVWRSARHASPGLTLDQVVTGGPIAVFRIIAGILPALGGQPPAAPVEQQQPAPIDTPPARRFWRPRRRGRGRE